MADSGRNVKRPPRMKRRRGDASSSNSVSHPPDDNSGTPTGAAETNGKGGKSASEVTRDRRKLESRKELKGRNSAARSSSTTLLTRTESTPSDRPQSPRRSGAVGTGNLLRVLPTGGEGSSIVTQEQDGGIGTDRRPMKITDNGAAVTTKLKRKRVIGSAAANGSTNRAELAGEGGTGQVAQRLAEKRRQIVKTNLCNICGAVVGAKKSDLRRHHYSHLRIDLDVHRYSCRDCETNCTLVHPPKVHQQKNPFHTIVDRNVLLEELCVNLIDGKSKVQYADAVRNALSSGTVIGFDLAKLYTTEGLPPKTYNLSQLWSRFADKDVPGRCILCEKVFDGPWYFKLLRRHYFGVHLGSVRQVFRYECQADGCGFRSGHGLAYRAHQKKNGRHIVVDRLDDVLVDLEKMLSEHPLPGDRRNEVADAPTENYEGDDVHDAADDHDAAAALEAHEPNNHETTASSSAVVSQQETDSYVARDFYIALLSTSEKPMVGQVAESDEPRVGQVVDAEEPMVVEEADPDEPTAQADEITAETMQEVMREQIRRLRFDVNASLEERCVKMSREDVAKEGRPVVFIHLTEGDATTDVRYLCEQLPFPVYCIRMHRDDNTDSMETMAKDYIKVLKERVPSGRPYRIIGYSYGASLAFAMATLLQADMGVDVIDKLLLVDGSPGHTRAYSRFYKTVLGAEAFANISDSGLFESELLCAVATQLDLNMPIATLRLGLLAKQKWAERLEFLLATAARYGASGSFKNPTDLRCVLRVACDVVRGRLLCDESYEPVHFQGSVSLVRASQEPRHIELDLDYGLSKVVTGAVDVRYVEGDADTMLRRKSSAKTLAAFITQIFGS